MQMIDESAAIRAVGKYFDGGLLSFLSNDEARIARVTMETIASQAGHDLCRDAVSDEVPALAAQDLS
jgi:hypothetical protein